MSPADGQRMTIPLGFGKDPLVDGRQSTAASQIARGVGRVLASLGLASISELPLPNGRRADVVAMSGKGEFWIVEIKSCVEDFRADQKWPEYWDFCDRFFFAVDPAFPQELLPSDVGLIVADRYGGEVVRHSVDLRMPAPRRRAMTLRFGRAAAARLQALADPALNLGTLLRGD